MGPLLAEQASHRAVSRQARRNHTERLIGGETMTKLTLISGAKDFLRTVFAHRCRQTELYVASFRLDATSQLPGRATKESARFLSDWKTRSDWSEI